MKWKILLFLALIMTVACNADEKFSGYYSDEISRDNFSQVTIEFNDKFIQKAELYKKYDQIVLFYKSTRTYEDVFGDTLQLIDVVYVIGKKDDMNIILGKIMPTATYDSSGNVISEIDNNSAIYPYIIGISESILISPLSVFTIIDKDSKVKELDPYVILKFDLENNSLMKFRVQLD